MIETKLIAFDKDTRKALLYIKAPFYLFQPAIPYLMHAGEISKLFPLPVPLRYSALMQTPATVFKYVKEVSTIEAALKEEKRIRE